MGKGKSGLLGGGGEPAPFKYEPTVPPMTDAEMRRAKDVSKMMDNYLNMGGGWQEYYEENALEDTDTFKIEGIEGYRDSVITVTKNNFVYAQNWDENDRRVKQGKAVTGSTFYTVDDNGDYIREDVLGFKTRADAVHAAQVYIDEQRQWRKYYGQKKR